MALSFFLGTFIPAPKSGFPNLPALLVGLALTSAATYTAKKAAGAAEAPQLETIFPASAHPGESVEVFGHRLMVGTTKPMVSIDKQRIDDASVTAVSSAGADHISFTIPAATATASHTVGVTTASGTIARTAAGVDFLQFEVT